MIQIHRRSDASGPAPDPSSPTFVIGPDILWVDLIDPTRDEELVVEHALGLLLPTRKEMAELEASSRLYRENGATYLTADLIHNGDAEVPAVDPVTFVMTPGPLVTIRYFDPRPFPILKERLERDPDLCGSAPDLFLNLMEAVIDRASDVLAHNAARVEAIAGLIFAGRKTVGFGRLIAQLGQAQMAASRIEQSLADLARVFAFVTLDERIGHDPDAREHLKSLSRDASSLSAHNQAVAANLNFQLSAALGLINIEQSSIIKIFSVAAVAFMPPTLIASIYGMNFRHMPELPQAWGYPVALAAMVAAAVMPLVWFKRKGWL
jgi:magnesium transporter